MKLLFDQNISFRIISKIENYSDFEIWKFAKENEFTIVTFDADFFDLSNFRGHPPKIIWLHLGNTTTDFLADIINTRHSIIKDFVNSDAYSEIACLEIK